MNKLEFLIGEEHGRRHHDAAIVLGNEDPRQALVDAAIQSIQTEVWVQVGDVDMHLAAWMDPEHWSEDWREKLGVELDDVSEAVDDLLASAVRAEA